MALMVSFISFISRSCAVLSASYLDFNTAIYVSCLFTRVCNSHTNATKGATSQRRMGSIISSMSNLKKLFTNIPHATHLHHNDINVNKV